MLSKILNTRTLIILLVVLGGIYLVTKLTEKEDRTFKSELVTIDTSRVTKMVIIPKTGAGSNITFTKSGNEWNLESEGRSYRPDPASIENILTELTRMRTERVASIDESKWDEMEVTDSTASRIQLYDGDEIITDLYLGKFSYSQAPQQNQYQQPCGRRVERTAVPNLLDPESPDERYRVMAGPPRRLVHQQYAAFTNDLLVHPTTPLHRLEAGPPPLPSE